MWFVRVWSEAEEREQFRAEQRTHHTVAALEKRRGENVPFSGSEEAEAMRP
jgi:hypothetical protein